MKNSNRFEKYTFDVDGGHNLFSDENLFLDYFTKEVFKLQLDPYFYAKSL